MKKGCSNCRHLRDYSRRGIKKCEGCTRLWSAGLKDKWEKKEDCEERMNDDETVNDLLRTLNDHLGDIHTELISIREAFEKANKEQMKSEEFAMGLVGGITEKLRNIALEAEGKKLVELVDKEEEVGESANKIVTAAIAVLEGQSCPECSNYTVSEKGEKHMCMRSEPEGRYIPGKFIMEGTIPDWCPLAPDRGVD